MMTAKSAEQRTTIMTTFTIDEQNNITAFRHPRGSRRHNCHAIRFVCHPEGTGGTGKAWPAERLLADLEQPAGRHTSQEASRTPRQPPAAFGSVSRTWARPQSRSRNRPGSRRLARRPRVAHRPPRARRRKRRRVRRPPPPRRRPKPKRPPRRRKPPGRAKAARPPRSSRCCSAKNGATLTEIMEKMNWQRHTVRGFMAGAMKKAGYTVESFKPEGGERTYRINQ